MKRLIGLLIFLNGWVAYSQPMRLSSLNLDHFTVRQRNLSPEFSTLVPRRFLGHPEIGLKPFDGPSISNCIELIDRRDAFSRYYVRENSHGSDFIIQKASAPINYRDADKVWREINYRLERKTNNLFVAAHQPEPVSINLEAKSISIQNINFKVETKIPELFFRDSYGNDHSLGTANFSNLTAGDDGIKIINFYPGIDLVFSVRRGEIETSFILTQRLPYTSGEIILRQQIDLPADLHFNIPNNYTPSHEEIYIVDNNQVPYFNFEKGYAYDNSPSQAAFNLQSRIAENNNLEFYVPVSWLANPATVYPVMIDPVLTTQNTVPVAGISGTKYSAVCWTNSCDNLLTVVTPPNCTITGILHSFEFYATGLCYADDGGYSIDYLGCHAPAAAPGVYTNAIHISNAFFTANNVLIPEFNTCLPGPQCAPQNLDFTLHFFRCNNDTDTSCNGNCIRATQPWIMFVEGHTVELSFITASQQICEGSNSQLLTTAQYGVAPYSYLWMPGGTTDDSVLVSPITSTTYSVTITDACGITATGNTTVNVTVNNNPGFTITPNPGCINVPVTLNGNGFAAPANYDWIVAGSSAVGGIVNDQQSPSVSYSVAGNYDVILGYPNGTCVFYDTLPVTITPLAVTSVALSAQPAGAICQGDVVSFHANPVNGGAAPIYDWFVDGVNVQSGTTDSLVTGALINGSQVKVVLNSNASCSAPMVDSASLFIAVANALLPQVTISPDTALCPGSALTLNALDVNGGATPSYQWFANGNPIAGATSSSYSFVVTPPDTVISVVINSSLSCVSTPIAVDSSTINILQNIQPIVTVTANPSGIICSGDSIHFTAHPVFGGGNPQYQWFVNGIPSAVTDSIFTITPANNDSISVQLTSSLTCVTTPTDDEYFLANVASSVNPAVTIVAMPSIISCVGDTVVFTASATNGGSTPVFSWSLNGNPVGINDSIFTISSLNDNDQVRVILNSSLSCAPLSTDTDIVNVTVVGNVAPSVTVSAASGAVCEGDTSLFVATASNGGPAPVYQWFLNGVAVGISSDSIILPGLNDNDTVVAIMTSSLACVAPSAATSTPYVLNLQPRVMPQINIASTPADTVCIGQQVSIQASVTNGGISPTINWYVNSILSPVTSTVFSSTTFSQGDVIVANMTSNANCLLQTGDTSNFIRIVYHQPLSVQVSSSPPDCPGELAAITAQVSGGNGGPYHIIWSNGSIDTNTIVITANRNTRVIVQAEDNCTQQPATFTYPVPVLTGPIANFAYQNPSPGSFQNNIQFINLSTDADSWTWHFLDDHQTSTDLNPLHQFPTEGTYDVLLVTQNNNGCIDSVMYNVTVKEEIAVFYPNSFTPNGDGRNDIFQPIGASLEDYEMTIYNRWGEIIYTGNSSSAWNGMINNSSSPAPEGVYVFRIDLKEAKFDERVVTGRVTLIR